MNIETIRIEDSQYPVAPRKYLGDRAPESIFYIGSLDLLRRNSLGLFCSVKCPGNLILKTYDLARELRDQGVSIISGFHSPMEKECLRILLRGKQPLIWCLAKRLSTRGIPKECAGPITEGRLLLLSFFGDQVKRATKKSALFRNEFVAALAERVFVAYAATGSKTEAFCQKVLAWRKLLLTFDTPDNVAMIATGARPYISPPLKIRGR